MLDFTLVTEEEIKDLGATMKRDWMKLRKALNDPPFNHVFHQAPCRRPRSRYWTTIVEDYHWHIELIPRLTRVAGCEWGSGFYINPTPPEVAAETLRETEV